MANYIDIRCATPAPQTIAYVIAESATGANWDPTKYYAVTVTASYDPDDENIWLTGVVNYGWSYSMANPTTAMEISQAGVSPVNADDSLVVTWTAPPGPAPHHYNVFIQGPNAADDDYDYTAYGNPMNSAAVSNDTFTFTILDPTDIQGSLVTATILYVVGSDIRIEGNHILQFGEDTPLTVDAAGANISTTVNYSQLWGSAAGLQTRINVDAALPGVVVGELITYRDLRHTFGASSGSTSDKEYSYKGYNDSQYYAVNLNPVIQLSLSMRNRMIRDNQGYLVHRARVLDAPVQYLDITVCGISTTYAEWQILMEYLRVGARLLLNDINDSSLSEGYYPFPQYLCRLVDTDYVGSIGKNARNRYRLRFEVEEQKAQRGAT